MDWGPSLNQRYVFDHEGNRLDTDYEPYLAIQGRGQTIIYLLPYEELRERLRPQDFCFLGFVRANQKQDYHEHRSGGIVPDRLLSEGYSGGELYWGDGVNFVRRRRRAADSLFCRAWIRPRRR